MRSNSRQTTKSAHDAINSRALLLLPLASHSADTIHLTGREAEAVQLATQVFKSKQGSKDQEGYPIYGDLRHYTVAD